MTTQLIKTEDYLILINPLQRPKVGELCLCLDELEHPKDMFVEHRPNNTCNGCRTILGYFKLNDLAMSIDAPLLPNPFDDGFNTKEWGLEEHKWNHKSIDEMSFALGVHIGYQKAIENKIIGFTRGDGQTLQEQINNGKYNLS